MAKLQTMEKIVLKVLEENIVAREDDYVLMYLVCEEINPKLNDMSFGTAMLVHKKSGYPNWETITRCRRKIQEKRPDLVVPKTARKRRKEEQEYRAYAHT